MWLTDLKQIIQVVLYAAVYRKVTKQYRNAWEMRGVNINLIHNN